MNDHLTSSAGKVQRALSAAGLQCVVRELPNSTRTAGEAADAVGCEIGQIVKSLLFIGEPTGTPILVLVSGRNRVSEEGLARITGQMVRKASANEVRQHTGFAIGGVPPLGHAQELMTIVDPDVLGYDSVWAAAGTPHALFCIDPASLVRVTNCVIGQAGLTDAHSA